MAIFLGVDTGGRYTDAVLMEDNERIIASSKSLTTKSDLSIGIGKAIQDVLDKSASNPSEIVLASLSTTLATNALVEGHGENVGLVAIGFTEQDLQRQGLSKVIKNDPVFFLTGGHTHSGEEKYSLDLRKLNGLIKEFDQSLSAYAVVSSFATRNPSHEFLTRDFIRDVTGKPVTCSSDLSAKLNGPKRALTSVLNARLIGLIDRLISACKSKLKTLNLDVPLMVVRGDGALISAEVAQSKPIETILSGPAASIVGAQWLTNESEALVSDIGGTTTDVAILHNGKPKIDPLGAKVGEFRTMVEAVDMQTTGLGGDSEVHMNSDGLQGDLVLGPNRVMPIALAATIWPDIVVPKLETILSTEKCGELDTKFVYPTMIDTKNLKFNTREMLVLEKIGLSAKALEGLISSRIELATLNGLISKGVLMMAGVTPTDASHVLGMSKTWDVMASRIALELFSKRRNGGGEMLASNAEDMARLIIERIRTQTANVLINVALIEDSEEKDLKYESSNDQWLISKGLESHKKTFFINFGLNLPVVGLGASAKSYYPQVGKLLSTKMVIPKYSEVANAIGAVAGRVSVKCVGTITSPAEGCYRLHGLERQLDFTSEEKAFKELEKMLSELAINKAKLSGADNIDLQVDRDIRSSDIENQRMFIDAEISVTASGRPRIT